MIELNNLGFSYSGKREGAENPVLESLNIRIEEGEKVALIGANGAGKSTLLRLLVGLLEGYSGEARVAGLPLMPLNYPKIREAAGFLFQDSDSQLFMRTVREDVAFSPRSHGMKEEEVAERVEKALQMVGIEALGEREIYKLSGGQKKLASIAAVLSMEPKLLLFDEPTVALDPRNRRRLIALLESLPMTMLLATHDLDMAAKLCRRAVLLYEGKIVFDGRTEEILRQEELLLRYGM